MRVLAAEAQLLVGAGLEWVQNEAIDLTVQGMFYGKLVSGKSIDLHSQQGHLSVRDGLIAYNGEPATMSQLAKLYPGLSVVFINQGAEYLGCYLKIMP